MHESSLTDFLQYIKFEKRYAPLTLLAYQADLEQYTSFLAATFPGQAVHLSTHFHVRSWLAGLKERKYTPRTVNRKLSSLNSYFRYLQRLGIIEANPLRKLHAQRLPERIAVSLKEAETVHLFDNTAFGEGFDGATDRLICELLYSTGMRRNELLSLKENDVEWSLKQLRILGKGNKERLVPVSDALLDTMRDYIQAKQELPRYNGEYLLNTPAGNPLYAGYVYRTVTRHLATATTMHKKSPHVLRHTFATHLLGNGANIQAIKDLLGHSSLAATQVYTHTDINRLKNIHKQNHPKG